MMYFNVNLVLLSYAISFLGAYLTISLSEQLRIFHLYNKDDSPTALAGSSSILVKIQRFFHKYKWFGLMGISLGGVGIWCMHFIGMSAMHLKIQNENGDWVQVPLFYDVGITITSLIVSIITTTIGMYVLSFDPLFAKSKSEILEMFVSDLQNLTLSDLKKKRNFTIIKLIVTKNLKSLISGGVITGCGVVLMHYSGMSAFRFEGEIHWNYGIIAASCFIAVIVATVAYWILFRLLSIFPNKEFLRIVSAAVMGIAVCGMHYTGMAAAMCEVKLSPERLHELQTTPGIVPAKDVGILVILCAMFVLWGLVIILFSDVRTNTSNFLYFLKKHHLQFSFHSVANDNGTARGGGGAYSVRSNPNSPENSFTFNGKGNLSPNLRVKPLPGQNGGTGTNNSNSAERKSISINRNNLAKVAIDLSSSSPDPLEIPPIVPFPTILTTNPTTSITTTTTGETNISLPVVVNSSSEVTMGMNSLNNDDPVASMV
jgi:NO-binding membrane sensor protein with MHYT domain